MLARVAKVARTDSTVLITGETGTGKELVARAIHRRSARASRAFVSVNCAAVPRELIASELFGHEKGAFTGATQRRLGRFELAHGGTIFLDEVGELPMETQVALLRVLQEREFERVGGSASVRVDVRVVAATNRDLQAAIEAGTFRSDLFYRLNVFPIAVPALRERADDIPLLVEYFIDRYARKAGKTIRRVNKRTLDHLRSYPWPGNVRELQNVIERSVIVCDTDEFTVDESWLSARPALEGRLGVVRHARGHEKADHRRRPAGERRTGLRPIGAAARLGIPRSTLESKIRALRINKNRFRLLTGRRRMFVVRHFTNWRCSPVSQHHPTSLDSAFCAGLAIALSCVPRTNAENPAQGKWRRRADPERSPRSGQPQRTVRSAGRGTGGPGGRAGSQGCRPRGSRHCSVPARARTRRDRASQLSALHPGMDRARRRSAMTVPVRHTMR